MRIARFEARGVYNHLNFDISFREDFTFLVGLNGTGKTSALKLIVALLAPHIAELVAVPFIEAHLTVINREGEKRTISARKFEEGLFLSVVGQKDPLVISTQDIQLLDRTASTEQQKAAFLARALEHPVCIEIASLGAPMFLGVDRRYEVPVRDSNDTVRRELLARRSVEDEASFRRGNVAAGLMDVNLLVHDTMSEVRGQQEKLDADLRNRLLTGAFDYKPYVFDAYKHPSLENINQYRSKQAEIESAVKSLRIPVDDVRSALTLFFERMNAVAKALEQEALGAKGRHSSKKKDPDRYGSGSSAQPQSFPATNKDLFEWFVNKPQVDRIFAHLGLLSTYSKRRGELRAPIDRFLELLNSFLEDTGKKVAVSDRGSLVVEAGSGALRSIAALSSGERQLVVMIGHLVLNKQSAGSGVFIVDEPELSLHISWQERFLDAIRIANPHVQIVLATHSPAIILDRDEHCVGLDRVKWGSA